jgi:tetratricopeptide (TPR) repeat protein
MLGYGVFSFAVLQVIEPIMHGAELPGWVLKAVLVALALGFPVAVVLAWIFDLTSQGVKRTPSAMDPYAPPFGRSRLLLPLAVSATVLVLAAVGAGAWHAWKGARDGGQRDAADGRTVVAVADFANQTGDADLDGLSGLLITSLEQSKKLRVMTRSRMWDHLRAMGRDRAERIDEPLAREIGKRSGARALLLASIRRLDDVYAVEMRAFDPNRDEYLFTVREQTSGKKGVLELIDRLSERTRIELREARTDLAASGFKVAEATTSSLEAYEHYFRGEQFAAAEKPTEALDAYQRAVKIDPGFAQAHLAIATLLRVVDPEQSSKALGEALLHANRLPDKERLLLRAQEAGLGYRTEEALGLLERVRERWPEDPDGYWLAGQLLIGQRGDFDRGLPFLDRAVALDAGRFQALIRAQLLGARLDDALKSALDFARQRPGPASLGLLTIVYSARGEVGHALEAARRAVQAGAVPTVHLLHAYIRAGALQDDPRHGWAGAARGLHRPRRPARGPGTNARGAKDP